ncbi:MAG: cyclic nucleotide-binding domain-containing protein [Anaerolineales bacterium]|nr:cyclic nucleotide-binding domain-containing protein [Anaerolineales bacterium]MCS7247634.1 cyclic nucleotide-binding domain-containing protein [Anaerolineales bacterium]MDW8161444.1 cyclic nucleotide-binding domain-containing protein [Anaerolineales bacterium]MDW8446575.1 cyclic nucleotide-binding domain-containing protein [Anaerolineales bacterium]
MNEDIFERSPFFADLSPKQLALLKPLFMPCSCREGELLFEQGDVADLLYLVVHGEVIVRYKPEDGPEIVVARVKPGGIVGWSAALGSRHYTSGAICAADSKLLCVRGDDLRRLCRQHPDTGVIVLERLADVIAERLHSTRKEVMTLLKQGLIATVCEP